MAIIILALYVFKSALLFVELEKSLSLYALLCISILEEISRDLRHKLFVLLGAIASCIYVDSLSSYVDNFEKNPVLNKRLVVPTVIALLESTWNSSDLPFEFNMGATLFGFLAYKMSFYQILAEELLMYDENLSRIDEI